MALPGSNGMCFVGTGHRVARQYRTSYRKCCTAKSNTNTALLGQIVALLVQIGLSCRVFVFDFACTREKGRDERVEDVVERIVPGSSIRDLSTGYPRAKGTWNTLSQYRTPQSESQLACPPSVPASSRLSIR
eukprot:1975430-Rhodomonas_salina.2